MEILILVGLACFVILAIKWLVWGKRFRKPPGPLGLPIVGYLPFMSDKPHLDLQRLAKIYGSIFSIRLGSQYVVVLSDYESTKNAFAMDAFMGRPPESPFDLNRETLETGAMNDLPWKEQRRFSMHMLRDLGFAKPRMEAFMREEIAELLEYFEKTGGRPVSVRKLLSPSMSNNIATLVFGERFKYDDPRRIMMDRLIRDSARLAGQVTWQLFFPWLKKLLQFLHIGDTDVLSRANREFREYIAKEIEQHEQTLDESNVRDYIDGYLLEIRKRQDPAFCKPVLQDMIGGFFGAGSETVRLTVDWLMLTMASYNDVQRKVQAEIDEVIKDRLPTCNDHISTPYTVAVVMEVMRWRTIMPINVLRYTLTDCELGGYFIPKHSNVIANLWEIHHNPQYWGSDSDIFRPERFLTEDGKEIKKSDYFIPWSIGKRACPGKPLAQMEVFIYFASILQKFNLRLPEGKIPDFEGCLGIGLGPKEYELCLEKRN